MTDPERVEALAEVLGAYLSDFDTVMNAKAEARGLAQALAPLLAEWRAADRAEALREAADEMEAVIADGDCAELAAPVPGEVGRSAVVARRDALYEEPHTWLRSYARATTAHPTDDHAGEAQ